MCVWGGGIYSLRKILVFMVSSSDLKYKLMRHVTFNPLLFWIAPGLILCIFLYEIQCINFFHSLWYTFFKAKVTCPTLLTSDCCLFSFGFSENKAQSHLALSTLDVSGVEQHNKIQQNPLSSVMLSTLDVARHGKT